MTPFEEADGRLGGMHGYAGAPKNEGDLEADRRGWPEVMGMSAVYAVLVGEQADRLARLEAKVDALMLALKAGAVGRWQ